MLNKKLVNNAVETIRAYAVSIDLREDDEKVVSKRKAARNAFIALTVSYGSTATEAMIGTWFTVVNVRKDSKSGEKKVLVPSGNTLRAKLRWIYDREGISYTGEKTEKKAPMYKRITYAEWCKLTGIENEDEKAA